MTRPARPRRFARWQHKLAAALSGIALFGLLELTCVLFGWGKPDLSDDPFVGFSAIQPLYVRNPATGLMETAPSRRNYFVEEEFAMPKPLGTYRVFCFGGSTVQGNPWSKETAFSTWLRLSLEAAAPERKWEVINCGGISYASYRLVNIVKECLNYQPDLFIICSGHNEFLEDRTYTDIKHGPPLLSNFIQAASHLRTFNLLRSAWVSHAQSKQAARKAAVKARTTMPEEIDPWLDYDGGIKAYHRDPAWREGVITHYELDLRRMVAMAHAAGVPAILVQPCSNLRDCPPFKSQHREGLKEADLQEWESLITEAMQLGDTNAILKLDLLQRALVLDDQYAATYYQLARCLDAQGQSRTAKDYYLQARELDICPLRMLARMEDAMARVARETQTPFINAHALLESRSRDGILGNDWLVDHIHPGIEGYQLIGNALFDEMKKQSWVHPTGDWLGMRDASYKRQVNSLPASYFKDGETHLIGLRAWTEGRAYGPSIDYKMLNKGK